MQISGKRLRDKEVDIIIESIYDLWYLQKFVHPGDVVKGEANRKVQINDKGVTNAEITKKTQKPNPRFSAIIAMNKS